MDAHESRAEYIVQLDRELRESMRAQKYAELEHATAIAIAAADFIRRVEMEHSRALERHMRIDAGRNAGFIFA